MLIFAIFSNLIARHAWLVDDWPEVYLNASTFYPSDLEQHMLLLHTIKRVWVNSWVDRVAYIY